jgi:hypothetical protein
MRLRTDKKVLLSIMVCMHSLCNSICLLVCFSMKFVFLLYFLLMKTTLNSKEKKITPTQEFVYFFLLMCVKKFSVVYLLLSFASRLLR